MEQIKVLSMIKELFCGGGGTRPYQFAQSINHDRFKQIIVSINKPTNEANFWQLEEYKNLEVEVLNLGEEDWAIGPIAYIPVKIMTVFRCVRKVCRLIRDHEIDVVDAHLDLSGFIGYIAARITGVKVMISIYFPPPERIWGWIGRYCTGHADVVMTDSQARARELSKWMSPNRDDICVIPTGIQVPSPQRSRTEMLDFAGITDEPDLKIIGSVGRFQTIKGQNYLIEAFAEIHRQKPETHLLCVGFMYHLHEDKRYKDGLEKMILDLGLEGRVHLVHYPGPIGDILQLIDYHCHPTIYDSLPIAIMEGMALGKPAVVTEVGGIPEMVDHEETGLIVPPKNPAALADALLRLMNDDALAQRLGHAAYERYKKRYSPAKRTREMEQVFYEMAVDLRPALGVG